MDIAELPIPDCYVISPSRVVDDRGFFVELMRRDLLSQVRVADFEVAQMNASASRRGTLRGIHASNCPGGQAKYVTCLSGTIIDVAVDLNPRSPTFGQWAASELSAENGNCMFLSPHAGHGFIVTSESALVVYLTSSPYQPACEVAIDALDPALGICWPPDVPIIRSERDLSAPPLASLVEPSSEVPPY